MKVCISFIIYIFLVCIPITGLCIIASLLVEKAIGYPIVVSALVTAVFIAGGGILAGWLWAKVEEKVFG